MCKKFGDNIPSGLCRYEILSKRVSGRLNSDRSRIFTDVGTNALYIHNNHVIIFKRVNSEYYYSIERTIYFHDGEYIIGIKSNYENKMLKFEPAKFSYEPKLTGTYWGHVYELLELGNFILITETYNISRCSDDYYDPPLVHDYKYKDIDSFVIYLDSTISLPVYNGRGIYENMSVSHNSIEGECVFDLENGQQIYTLRDETNNIVVMNNLGEILPHTKLKLIDKYGGDGNCVYENDHIKLLIGYEDPYLQFINKIAGAKTKAAAHFD
jgi:hypothetical protein